MLHTVRVSIIVVRTLMLDPKFFLKSGQTLAISRCEAMLATEIQVIAQPLVVVQTLPGYQVLLRQPRLVATGEFRGTASMSEVPGLEGLR